MQQDLVINLIVTLSCRSSDKHIKNSDVLSQATLKCDTAFLAQICISREFGRNHFKKYVYDFWLRECINNGMDYRMSYGMEWTSEWTMKKTERQI